MSTSGAFLADQVDLHALASSSRAQYAQASPFPHIVLDGIFDEARLAAVIEEFPDLSRAPEARHDDDMHQKKHSTRSNPELGPATGEFIEFLNGQQFLTFLGKLTGIEALQADPTLEGGGLHEIRRGGLLKIHADFNKHRHTGFDRRLNVLIYLNRDWADSYGGALELWDRDMTRCVQRIPPVFNRMVVFTTSQQSYHGHPEPLACPPERSRRSLALYYYTRPDVRAGTQVEGMRHSTLFQRRPGTEDGRGRVTSLVRRVLRRS